jgi:uncharacterized RDD family membrane protein YckC
MPRIPIGFGRLAQGAGDALEPVAESAVDRMLAGTLPEAVARSIVRHHVLERMTAEIVSSPEFRAAFTAALNHEQTGELAKEVAKSPLVAHLITDVVSSAAVRSAIAEQTASVGNDLVETVREKAIRTDATLERGPRRWLGRAPRLEADAPGGYAGLVSRALGFIVDSLLIALVFLIAAGTVTLIASLAAGFEQSWVYGVLAAFGTVLVSAVYFVGFWWGAGKTPGMALMGLRVRDRQDRPPGFWRSCVRFVGLWIAFSFILLGFVPVLVDDRRRALQDFLAGTVVVYDDSQAHPAGGRPAHPPADETSAAMAQA